MATVGGMGESALIERLAERVRRAGVNAPDGMEVVLGIGDDAAAWRTAGTEAATTDTMVEGVHFRRTTSSWSDVGWKSWTSNVSDMAAMGARPLAGLVALGLPGDLPMAAVDALYDGMLEACARYGTALLGGDVVESPVVFVTVAMVGCCEGAPFTRSAVRVGDAIAVTGPLGAARGGLRLLEEAQAIETPAREALASAHRRPAARTDAAPVLRRHGVRCAMDLSDGLAADLPKLAKASGVGARVEVAHVPVASALRSEFGGEALELALAGGEEYELLFAGAPSIVRACVEELPGSAVIGEAAAGSAGAVEFVDSRGERVDLDVSGWEHLR